MAKISGKKKKSDICMSCASPLSWVKRHTDSVHMIKRDTFPLLETHNLEDRISQDSKGYLILLRKQFTQITKNFI